MTRKNIEVVRFKPWRRFVPTTFTMPQNRRLGGPLNGHWCSTLQLIEVDQDGTAFVCKLCVQLGVEEERATIKSARNASNLYAHMKTKHSTIYEILSPVIQGRNKNKRARIEHIPMSEAIARSRQKTFDDALVALFSSPDIPKSILEHQRFIRLIRSSNPLLKVATVKTVNSWLWCRFHSTISRIRTDVSTAEFIVLTCDGWPTYGNYSVMGFMVTYLDAELRMVTKCLGNFKMTAVHSGSYICELIRKVVVNRPVGCSPSYYVSDSAPVNKLAVRLFEEDEGDEHWFPCSVHFAQLTMRESVFEFLNPSTGCSNDIYHAEYEEMDDNTFIDAVRSNSESGTFERLVHTSRAIRAALKRKHSYADLFRQYQTELNVKIGICSDVKTRFDSRCRCLHLSTLTRRFYNVCKSEEDVRTLYSRGLSIYCTMILILYNT